MEFKIFIPRNTNVLTVILVCTACVYATTQGYDASIMTGLNIMPAYLDFFHLGTVSTSLLTAGGLMGAIFSAFAGAPICNQIGRKNTILISIVINYVGIVLMTAAQNFGMFISGRIVLGIGSGISGVATTTWLAETLPYRVRGAGLSLIFAVYFVGALVAAGVTYATSSIPGNLSWRIPSAIQVTWTTLALILLGFTPESPRWLVYKGRFEEALEVVSLTHSNGDVNAQETRIQYQEIIDTLKWEKECGVTLSMVQMVKTKGARKRVLLVLSVAVCTTLMGNSVITYFLGSILTAAGISNSHTQLEINIILNAWNLVIALIGAYMVGRIGRRPLALASAGLCTIFLFLVGALTKLYGNQSENRAGIYGTVAMIFLFQGSFAFGMTNLTLLYPPEVCNYSMRANGMAVFLGTNYSLTIFTIFALPIGLAHIGYKLYFINAVWDVLQVLFIYFVWVETNGKTLEEIDEYFDGEKHSEVPDITNVEVEIFDEKTIG